MYNIYIYSRGLKYIHRHDIEVSGICKSLGTVCLDGFCWMCEYCDILSSLWLWRANMNVIILSLLILCEALQGRRSARLKAASLQRALWGRTCPWEGRQMSGINASAGSAHRWTPASVWMTQDTALAGARPQTCEKTFRRTREHKETGDRADHLFLKDNFHLWDFNKTALESIQPWPWVNQPDPYLITVSVSLL